MASFPSSAARFGISTANGSGAFASLYAALAELQDMSGKSEECNGDVLPLYLNSQANPENSCLRCLLKTCKKVGGLWRENNQLRSTLSSAPPQFQFGASSSSSAQIHGTQVHGAQNPDYKTKICDKWILGTCTYGLQCNFAHGSEELRPVIRYCWSFLREGVCKKGESCPYLHAKPPSEFSEYK